MRKKLVMIVGLTLPFFAQASGGDWEAVDAGYEVPAPAELAAYANFPKIEIKRRIREGRTEYEYSLPVELTGNPIEVHVVDVDGRGVLFRGPVSEMRCEGDDCSVRYPGLKIEPEEVQNALVAKGVQGDELKARMAVFARFEGGDPAGVIHYRK